MFWEGPMGRLETQLALHPTLHKIHHLTIPQHYWYQASTCSCTNYQSSLLISLKLNQAIQFEEFCLRSMENKLNSSFRALCNISLTAATTILSTATSQGHRGIRWWMLRANLDSICLKGKKGLCQGHRLHSLLSLEELKRYITSPTRWDNNQTQKKTAWHWFPPNSLPIPI